MNIARLFAAGSLAALSASCVPAALSAGPTEAKAALRCESLDTFFPLPHRYANVRPQYDLYRGCGKYAVLRCVQTTAKSSCVTVEVMDARTAESEAPLSFAP